MSTVIGVCGTNFCSLCGDSRRVAYSSKGVEVINDTTQKVFKINDRVLFGAMGVFDLDTDFLDPFKSYSDKSILTVHTAYETVINYMMENIENIRKCLFRNYMVGGKNEDGKFCIYEIHFNFGNGEIETALRMPEPPKYNFGISCGLPIGMQSKKQQCLALVEGAVTSSKEHREMLLGIAGIIGAIAKHDITVGGDVQTVSVF